MFYWAIVTSPPSMIYWNCFWGRISNDKICVCLLECIFWVTYFVKLTVCFKNRMTTRNRVYTCRLVDTTDSILLSTTDPSCDPGELWGN